jgi:hypothetical protein
MANIFDVRENTKWWQGLHECVEHVWIFPEFTHYTCFVVFQVKQEHSQPWMVDKSIPEYRKFCAWVNELGLYALDLDRISVRDHNYGDRR